MIRLVVKLVILALAVYGGQLLWETHLKEYFDFDGVQSQGQMAEDIANKIDVTATGGEE